MTLGKPEPGYVNEDAVSASQGVIAVSDGAGGGGLFADRWARYLLDKLPTAPIRSAEALDEWIGNIWEPFYNDCEPKEKEECCWISSTMKARLQRWLLCGNREADHAAG